MPSAGIERLGITKLASAVAFGSSGTTAFTATDNFLVSVIASNTVSTDAEIYVYVVPSGATTSAEYGLIAYSLPLSGYNTYETFRFAMKNNDVLKVAGSAGVSFYVQGIDQVTA
jgi:hypothetical protein